MMNVFSIWKWSKRCDISSAIFREAFYDAYLIATSRLLRSLAREKIIISDIQVKINGDYQLILGYGSFIALITRPGSLGFWELKKPLSLRYQGRELHSLRHLLTSLKNLLNIDNDDFLRLQCDFLNSFTNLLLNHLLIIKRALNVKDIPEPSYKGSFIHPFPVLRIGIDHEDISNCSNLNTIPVKYPLFEFNDLVFNSINFNDVHTLLKCIFGADYNGQVVIPIHPWQLKHSPIVQSLIFLRQIKPTNLSIDVSPLASQRTGRIKNTGFDIKLPINVTITGEHRLLYEANLRNSVEISSLVKRAISYYSSLAECKISIQQDIATLAHPDSLIGTHIAAIIREPLHSDLDSVIIPALNLWTIPDVALSVFSIQQVDDAYAVYEDYCRILLNGSLWLYCCAGIALEPHVQNVLVKVKNNRPLSIIVRDLDSTILDKKSIRLYPNASSKLLESMPPYDDGGLRLSHSLIHAHLALVESLLLQIDEVKSSILEEIFKDMWESAVALLPRDKRSICKTLIEGDRNVKCLLKMRLKRSMKLEFI
jgi:hypothetical protein